MSRAAEAAATMMDTGRDTAPVQTVAAHDENNAETGLRASVEVLGEERLEVDHAEQVGAGSEGVGVVGDGHHHHVATIAAAYDAKLALGTDALGQQEIGGGLDVLVGV